MNLASRCNFCLKLFEGKPNLAVSRSRARHSVSEKNIDSRPESILIKMFEFGIGQPGFRGGEKIDQIAQ